MTENILHLNDSNFDEEIKKHPFMIVDFWAVWCAPCQMFASILEEFANENPDITCAKLNVDENPQTASKFGIRSIPSILFFKNGELVDQQVGALPKQILQQVVDRIK